MDFYSRHVVNSVFFLLRNCPLLIPLHYTANLTIKVNLLQIIDAHNAKIRNEKTIIDPNRKTCNCTQPTKCPLDGNCLSSCIVCKVTVSSEKEQVAYIGLTSTTSRERYNNHSKSFNHEKYENETELSKYVWKLKKNSKFSITWKIISHATTKTRPSNQCNLCLEEKHRTLKHSEKKPCLLINKRF